MFSPEELKALEDTTTHAIDIGQFGAHSTPWIRCILRAPIIWRRTRAVPSPTPCSPRRFAKLSNAPSAAGFPRGKEHIVIIRALEDGLSDAPAAFQGGGSKPEGPGIEAHPVSGAPTHLHGNSIDQLGAKAL